MSVSTIRSRLRAIHNAADSLDGILEEVEGIALLTTKEQERVIAALERIARQLERLADYLGSFVDPQQLKPNEKADVALEDLFDAISDQNGL